MKTRLFFISIFSLFFLLGSAQSVQDSTKVKPKWKYKPNVMVGVDLLSAGIGAFSDRKLFQGFLDSRINQSFHAMVDLGYEKNVYQKNGYNAQASGSFIKMGGIMMLVMDPENTMNGLYTGAKLAATLYKQEYYAIPVRGFQGGDQSVAYPSSSQSSYWFEAVLGGRIQLFKSNFYVDVNAQPRYMVYTTKQDNIVPMIVPGFGKSSTKFNVGFSWSVAYKF